MSNDELYRLLSNLIRLGNIVDVDYDGRAVRVQTGALTTNWLKWLTARAGASKTWDPPSVGEQVILFAPEGDLTGAFVFPSLDSDQNPPPSTSPDEVVRTFPDGARFGYDHAAGALTVMGIKTMSVEAADNITLKAPEIKLDAEQTTSTGKHTVEGLLTYLAGMAGSGGSSGAGTTITGDFTHEGGNLSSNGVVVHLHVHGGVVRGGANTDGPT